MFWSARFPIAPHNNEMVETSLEKCIVVVVVCENNNRKKAWSSTQIVTRQGTKMYGVTTFVFFLLLSFAQTQDKFQKCCGDRKLYYKGKFQGTNVFLSRLSRGKAKVSEWTTSPFLLQASVSLRWPRARARGASGWLWRREGRRECAGRHPASHPYRWGVSHHNYVGITISVLSVSEERWVHLQCGPDQEGASVQRPPPALVLSLWWLGLQGETRAWWLSSVQRYFISEDLSLPAIWPDFWQDNTPGPSLGRLQANLKYYQNFKLTFNKIYTWEYKFQWKVKLSKMSWPLHLRVNLGLEISLICQPWSKYIQGEDKWMTKI